MNQACRIGAWITVLGLCLGGQAQDVERIRDPRSGHVVFLKNPKAEMVSAALSRTTPRIRPVTRPREVSARAGVDPVMAADAFLDAYGREYGLENPVADLVPVQVKLDRFGNQHIYYRQEYQGVPVFGSEILVHLDKIGRVTSSNGRIVQGINVPAEPTISVMEAVAAGRNEFMSAYPGTDPTLRETKLVVLNLGLLKNEVDPVSHLAFKVSLHQVDPLVGESVFVDAHDGAVVFRLDEVMRADPVPIDRRIYDCSMNFFSSGVGCGLDDDYRAPTYTYGCSEGRCPRGPNPLSAPYGGTTDVDDLYYLWGHIHDYLWQKFQRNGGNGRGGIGNGQTTNGVNAPYEATVAFAYADAAGAECNRPLGAYSKYSVYFCRGAIIADLVAHEYGHSLTHYHS